MMSRREGRRKSVAKHSNENRSRQLLTRTSSTGTIYSVVGLAALAKVGRVVRQSFLTQ